MDAKALVAGELSRIEPRLLEFALVAPPETIELCEQAFSASTQSGIRANAVLLACLIDPERGLELARRAAVDIEPLVRIASVRSLEAFTSDQIRNVATDVLHSGLADQEEGVRKYALKLFQKHPVDSLLPLVKRISDSDTSSFLRDLAAMAVRQ